MVLVRVDSGVLGVESVECFLVRGAGSIFDGAAGSVFKKSSGIGDRRRMMGVFLNVGGGLETLPGCAGEDTERWDGSVFAEKGSFLSEEMERMLEGRGERKDRLAAAKGADGGNKSFEGVWGKCDSSISTITLSLKHPDDCARA